MTQTRRILSKTSKACIKQPTIVAKSKIQKTLYARSCARACESPEIALPNYNLSDGARAVGKSAPGGPLHPHPTSYAAYTPVDQEVFDHTLTDRLPSFVRYSLFGPNEQWSPESTDVKIQRMELIVERHYKLLDILTCN